MLGKTVGEETGEDVVEVKRYGTNPDVVGETVGVEGLGVTDVEGIVEEYFALHLQYIFSGLVGAATRGPSVGLIGGAKLMRTGVLRAALVVTELSASSALFCLLPPASVVRVTGCEVRR